MSHRFARRSWRAVHRNRLPMFWLAGAFALFLAAAMPLGAAAHANLDTSDPSPNAVVPEVPASVTMRFTEPLERNYSKAELYDEAGELVAGTSVEPGSTDKEMVLTLPADLPNGTYSVLWRTLSTADGHTAQNYFAFTIGTDADVTQATGPEASGGGPPLWLRTVARWSALLGLAAAAAAWPIWLLVIRPSLAPVWRLARPVTRRMRRLTAVAILLALAGNLFALAVQAASLTDGSLVDRIRTTLGDTRYGELWYYRLALLFALAITLQWVAWWWPWRRPVLTTIALLLSAAVVVPFSFIAHASALTTGRSAAILADIMHLLSASIWVGGLFVLVSILVPTIRSLAPPKRRMVLSMALPRFSVIALIAWATLALTGLYSAWLHVGSFDGLLHTDYGKALLTKLAILVPILGLAAFNLFAVTSRLHAATGNPERVGSWTRRFSYTIACEAVLAIAVLAVVGTLTAEAPARETLASAPAGMEIALTGGERDADLTISPGTPGPNRFDLEVSGEPMLHETEVLLRVKSTGQDTGEKDLRFIHGGGSTYTYEGSELSLAGKWDMQLIVRQPDAPEWRAFATVDIETAKPAASPTAPWVLGNVGGIAGSLLALAGVALLMIAWHEPGIRRRMPLAAAGAVIIAIAVIVLVFAKTDATGDIAQLAARIA